MARYEREKLGVGRKLQLFILPVYSREPATLYGASIPPHPDRQRKKGGSIALDLTPRKRSRDQCPDGGLRVWLGVLGDRLPVYESTQGD